MPTLPQSTSSISIPMKSTLPMRLSVQRRASTAQSGQSYCTWQAQSQTIGQCSEQSEGRIEEHFASGKRNKKEAGSKYGW
jgi:hypothetical protein